MSPTATIDQRVYRIPNMDCAAEEAEIRHALKDIAGLRALRFYLGARELHVEATPSSLPEVEASLRAAGFAPAGDAAAAHDHDHTHDRKLGTIDWSQVLLAPNLPRIVAAMVMALYALAEHLEARAAPLATCCAWPPTRSSSRAPTASGAPCRPCRCRWAPWCVPNPAHGWRWTAW